MPAGKKRTSVYRYIILIKASGRRCQGFRVKRLVLPHKNTVDLPSDFGQYMRDHVTSFVAWRDNPDGSRIWFLIKHKAYIAPLAGGNMA